MECAEKYSVSRANRKYNKASGCGTLIFSVSGKLSALMSGIITILKNVHFQIKVSISISKTQKSKFLPLFFGNIPAIL